MFQGENQDCMKAGVRERGNEMWRRGEETYQTVSKSDSSQVVKGVGHRVERFVALDALQAL